MSMGRRDNFVINNGNGPVTIVNNSGPKVLEPVVPAVIVTHSWVPYSCLSVLYAIAGIGWLGAMIATVSGHFDAQTYNATNGGSQVYTSPLTSQFFTFINFYLWRMLTLFAALTITYSAERHYLSRSTAWTAFVMNFLLFVSWMLTDLPFVFSGLSYYAASNNGATNTNGQPGNANDSIKQHYCSTSGVSSYYCDLTYIHIAFDLFATALIVLTWFFNCYQLSRARGVSRLLLNFREITVIILTVFGIFGYLCWSVSSYNVGMTRNFTALSFFNTQSNLNSWQMSWPSLVWADYMLQAAFILSLSSAAFISFGGTTAPRMMALITNWMSFMVLVPSTIFLLRNQADIGTCDGSLSNQANLCPELTAIGIGMGFCAFINMLIGSVMFLVLMSVETADYAIDMYGVKALAVDDPRSTGKMPVVDNYAGAVYDEVNNPDEVSIPINDTRRSSASTIYNGTGYAGSRRGSEEMVQVANVRPIVY